MRFSTVGVATVAVAIGVTLAGCGGDPPEPAGLDTPSPRASSSPTDAPSPTPTPTRPPSPASTTPGKVTITGNAVDPAAAQAAVAFVKQYLVAQNNATANGEFAVVLRLVSSTCSVCSQSRNYISSIYREGGRIEGGTFTNPKVSVVGGDSSVAVVRVDATISAYKVYSSSGKVTDSGKAEPQTFTYSVQKASTGDLQITGGSAKS